MPKQRLLVIEDDVDVSDMLLAYFSSQGFETFIAENGQAGVALARARFPNLILLDLMLPDIDGFEVARTLRTAALTRHIPIVFLTQRDRRSDKISGLELGADDYLTKPFDLEELRLRVSGSLTRSTRERLYDPRTGLPNKALLDDELPRLRRRTPCFQFDANLANYVPFREVYGWIVAEELLSYWGQVVRETLAKHGTPDDMAGMLAEDRYQIFTLTADVEPLVSALMHRFAEGARAFYSFIDRERGYMPQHDAHGNTTPVPLMMLSLKPVLSASHARS